MIKLILIILLLSGCSSMPYVKANLEYAVEEMKRVKTDPRKIHIEGGFKQKFDQLTLSYGGFHDSQPFVHGIEYYKTGVFVGFEYIWE